MTTVWDLAQRRIAGDPYADDPAGWVHGRLGEHMWSKQVEIAEAVRDHRKVAVKACHGPGKSFTGARMIGWWIDTHPIGQAFAVSSAPTTPQVKAILWRELTRAHKRGRRTDNDGATIVEGLDGRITQDAQWKIDDELVAYGRKPADHDDDGFQGIHARYVLVILDEACGIPRTLWTATDTLVTNQDSRILAIGNPDHPTSRFAEICAGAPGDGTSGMSALGWWVITISVFDTPNFTGEPIPDTLRHSLPSQVWLNECRVNWGEDSPLWTSKVLGEFPTDDTAGTIPWSKLKECQSDEVAQALARLRSPVELGIDVAGSDVGDETVIYERTGARIGRHWSVRSSDSEVVLATCEQAVREAKPSRVKIDAIGVGWGLVAGLRRSFPGLDVHPVVVSEAAPGEDAAKFYNLRAYLWWEVGRRPISDHAYDLTAVPDEALVELSQPKYTEKKGRIVIESKDEIRKRLGRSPDHADAILLAFYEPPERGEAEVVQYRRRAGR